MLYCAFCGKNDYEVKQLFQGAAQFFQNDITLSSGKQSSGKERLSGKEEASDKKSVYICDECVVRAQGFLDRQTKGQLQDNARLEQVRGLVQRALTLPSPSQLKEKLDQYVIGQDDTKIALSVAVHNHYKRTYYGDHLAKTGGAALQKSNVLMIGPTGTGKTLLARILADTLQVPFVIGDATSLTETGYVGDDVESLIERLVQKADYDIESAAIGIIYIDEIDKIARRNESASQMRDISGEGVQQALLKIIEGTETFISQQGGRKHPDQEMLSVNTEHILFICSGAFDGLEHIVNKRLQGGSMGFQAILGAQSIREKERILAQATSEDLVKYGLIPEFIGRLPVLTSLNSLDEAALIRVLKEPQNAIIKQYQDLFALEGVVLEFTEEALRAIAQKAILLKSGARGLRGILEKVLLKTMFTLPEEAKIIEKMVITEACVTHAATPEKIKKSITKNKAKKDNHLSKKGLAVQRSSGIRTGSGAQKRKVGG